MNARHARENNAIAEKQSIMCVAWEMFECILNHICMQSIGGAKCVHYYPNSNKKYFNLTTNLKCATLQKVVDLLEEDNYVVNNERTNKCHGDESVSVSYLEITWPEKLPERKPVEH